MKHLAACVAVLAATALHFGLEARAHAAASKTIDVTFTNNTDLNVAFMLNGGDGLRTTLAAGASKTYTMVIDPGVQPAVKIYQVSGAPLSFSVSDGGDYTFQVDSDGKIRNHFK